jgi:hypothetical protein
MGSFCKFCFRILHPSREFTDDASLDCNDRLGSSTFFRAAFSKKTAGFSPAVFALRDPRAPLHHSGSPQLRFLIGAGCAGAFTDTGSDGWAGGARDDAVGKPTTPFAP